MGLWVTNGTAPGTRELTGITGADPSGLAPSDLTVYNSEVLFRGLDQLGRPQLWVTNGTVTGTHELTGIVGAGTTAGGFNPSGFTVFDGTVLFSGVNSSGHNELWTTNGTAAGTKEVSPIAGTQVHGLSPVDLTALSQADPLPPPPKQDPPAPTTPAASSILWQNMGTGQASIWEMNGSTHSGGGPVSPSPGRNWRAIGTGDFNDDGNSDILWQNTSTGQASIWEMNGTTQIGGGVGPPQSGTGLESDRNRRFQR